mmetsp:Transcript_5713/g.10174  ORF Transcript_5713/g.10174 Transcript_5713/m.10174 type:complete len:308 (+) Transcript_5713:89-1012(+)
MLKQSAFKLANGDECPIIHLPRRSTFFLAFDLILIFTFVVGWALTFIDDLSKDDGDKVILDNPLLRVAGFNPITVGINHFPARIMANIVWGIMLFPLTMYFVGSLFHYHYCGFSTGVKRFLTFVQVVSYFFVMGFGLLVGFEPKFNLPKFKRMPSEQLDTDEDFLMVVWQIEIHFLGFILMMAGLGAIRGLEIFSFYTDPSFKGNWPSNANVYIGAQLFYVLLCLGGIVVPAQLMFKVHDHLKASITDQIEYTWFSFEAYISYAWRILFVVVPLFTWWLTPKTTPIICVTQGSAGKKGPSKATKYYP